MLACRSSITVHRVVYTHPALVFHGSGHPSIRHTTYITEIMYSADERIFPLASVSRPALGPTQPPVQWVPGVLSPGVKRGRGVTLTSHPHLVLRSRMSRSYILSPLPPSDSMACSETAIVYCWTSKKKNQLNMSYLSFI
jgi:hypothetical protein